MSICRRSAINMVADRGRLNDSLPNLLLPHHLSSSVNRIVEYIAMPSGLFYLYAPPARLSGNFGSNN